MNIRGHAWLVVACFVLCLYCAPHKTPPEADPPAGVRETVGDRGARSRHAHGSNLPVLEIFDLKRVGRYLRGTVRAEQGRPLMGILIVARGTDGAPPFTAATKKDGSFFVMAPAGQAYVLIIDNPHFQKLSLRLSSSFGVGER